MSKTQKKKARPKKASVQRTASRDARGGRTTYDAPSRLVLVRLAFVIDVGRKVMAVPHEIMPILLDPEAATRKALNLVGRRHRARLEIVRGEADACLVDERAKR